MFEKGVYIKKNDGHRISKHNKYPVMRINSCVPGKDGTGNVLINGTLTVKLEWFSAITKEEYDEIKKQIDDKSLPVPQSTQELLPIQPGMFIRKRNWEFIRKNVKISKLSSDLMSHLPSIKVTSVKRQPNPYMINVNGYIYNIDAIKIITEDEHNFLIDEWNNTKLSEVLQDKLETVHYREETGDAKKQWSLQEALMYIFTYNKKNPGKNMNAYQCPYCGYIHCGKIPQDRYATEYILVPNDQFDLIAYSIKLERLIKSYWPSVYEKEMEWNKMHSLDRKINVSNYDIVATQRHFATGWVKLFELVPRGQSRYVTNITPTYLAWTKEFKGMKTVFLPPKHVRKHVEKKIKSDASWKLRVKNYLKFLFYNNIL